MAENTGQDEAQAENASASYGPQLSPLSVQAASLVRSIDALSSIFWICLVGFFVSILFAGLSQLEGNANTDFIYLGEYQIPKSILPLACLSLALFAFWLVSNRLSMLRQVLASTTLTKTMVHDLFNLNPPVLHVFDKSNANVWGAFTGVSVFFFIWSVFLGNSIALTWESVVQQGATLAEFDEVLLSSYAVATIAVFAYGVRTIVPPLRAILLSLHDVDFSVGWPRYLICVVVVIITFAVNQSGKFDALSGQQDGFIGPAYANAIDGETLFMGGIEVNLFGIDAMEADQLCQDAKGQNYQCGVLATQALQSLVQMEQVICVPLFAINTQRVSAMCELMGDEPLPDDDDDFTETFRPNSLSRLQVVEGHAIAIGVRQDNLDQEQLEAQTLRKGIRQGSFMPPRLWRQSNQ